MSELTTAQKLVRVNIVLLVVLSALLIVCLVRQLWLPAAVFALLISSNAFQLVTRRRDA
ncbi:hypothetical protein [Ilumatobacter nonamiensis]|uniref:hypothetical protein n=1 Tax=Ilumatobacter nonamiensis TaxID=467093 RepID=UPI000344F01F|nr:hypothetical protein [Ilumatobacter nonamiensis]